MAIYVVEIWHFGSDFFANINSDIQSVAIDFDVAKNHFNSYPEWSIALIKEYVAETGKCNSLHYFVNVNEMAKPVNFDEIYTAYR